MDLRFDRAAPEASVRSSELVVCSAGGSGLFGLVVLLGWRNRWRGKSVRFLTTRLHLDTPAASGGGVPLLPSGCRTRRFTRWQPRSAGWQFENHGGAAIGELNVRIKDDRFTGSSLCWHRQCYRRGDLSLPGQPKMARVPARRFWSLLSRGCSDHNLGLVSLRRSTTRLKCISSQVTARHDGWRFSSASRATFSGPACVSSCVSSVTVPQGLFGKALPQPLWHPLQGDSAFFCVSGGRAPCPSRPTV